MSWFNKLAKGVATTAAIASTGGVGAIVTTALNMFLDDDDKVNSQTPMSDVEAKYNKLTPEQQTAVGNAYYDYLKSEKEFAFKTADSNNTRDVEILRIKEVADSGDGAIRPWAVKWSVVWVGSVSLAYSFSMLFVAWNGEVAATVLPSWEDLSAALAVPSWIIRSYFSDRSTDKENKLNAVVGNPITTKVGAIANTIKAFKS